MVEGGRQAKSQHVIFSNSSPDPSEWLKDPKVIVDDWSLFVSLIDKSHTRRTQNFSFKPIFGASHMGPSMFDVEG